MRGQTGEGRNQVPDTACRDRGDPAQMRGAAVAARNSPLPWDCLFLFDVQEWAGRPRSQGGGLLTARIFALNLTSWLTISPITWTASLPLCPIRRGAPCWLASARRRNSPSRP